MNKSYQEHILEKTIKRFSNDTAEALLFMLAEAIKDCFAISRLEAEEVTYARTAPFNESSREKMKAVQDEIKSILAKYNLEP